MTDEPPGFGEHFRVLQERAAQGDLEALVEILIGMREAIEGSVDAVREHHPDFGAQAYLHGTLRELSLAIERVLEHASVHQAEGGEEGQGNGAGMH